MKKIINKFSNFIFIEFKSFYKHYPMYVGIIMLMTFISLAYINYRYDNYTKTYEINKIQINKEINILRNECNKLRIESEILRLRIENMQHKPINTPTTK